jgi:pimeloyl-[acyl-carrier protein] methyl ester esterase
MSLAFCTLGSGPDLVMLHGWGMHSSIWIGFAERLAEHYRLCMLDLPGHGNSPYRGERELDDWARACLEVAPERALWLGWSLGAQLALQAALAQPQRVAGVIGVCGTPRFVQDRDWPHAMTLETLQQFITASRQDHHKTLERFLALQVRGGDDSLETLRLLRERLRIKREPEPEALDAGLELLKTVDLRGRLAELACPSAWLFGERDTLVPAGLAVALGELLSRPVTRVIPGSAHAPFLSHPGETLDILCQSLESFDVT